MDNGAILISSDSSDAGSPVSVHKPRTFEFQNVDIAASCSTSSTALPTINEESEIKSKIGSVLRPTLSQFSHRIMQSLADSDDDDGHHTSGGNDWPPAQSSNCRPTLKRPRPSPTEEDTSDLNNISSSTVTMPNIPVCKSDCFTSDAAKRLVHTLSDDSDEEPLPSGHSSQESNRFAHTLSDDSEDEAFLPGPKQSQNVSPLSNQTEKVKVGLVKTSKLKRPRANTKTAVEDRRNAAKAEKERKKGERLQKLAAQAESKAIKQALAQEQKMYKPEECLKYLTAELDNCLFEEEFGGDLKSSLEEVEVAHSVRAQIIPLSISWTRKLPDGDKFKIHDEDHTLIVIPCERVMQLVQSHSLCAAIQNMQAIIPDKKVSIVLHGTEKYFQSQKGKSKKSGKVSREDFMDAMVEVQLFTGCTHRFVDSSLELATLISQYSKAVAEIPHRKAKARKENDKLDWFGESDNRDCVRVDKNGLGLQRLWQQQLCEFNLAGLQVAEAITSVYHSPQALFKAYDVCSSQAEGEKLLQDIPIRRDLGALSSVRRIGPELSKKFYTFFNASEGHVELSQE